MQNKDFGGSQNTYYQRRVLWELERTPDWHPGKTLDRFGYISIPQLLQMSQRSLDEIYYSRLLIRLHDEDNIALIDQIAKDLFEATGLEPNLTYQIQQDTE